MVGFIAIILQTEIIGFVNSALSWTFTTLQAPTGYMFSGSWQREQVTGKTIYVKKKKKKKKWP